MKNGVTSKWQRSQPRGALGRRTRDLRRALRERPSRAGEGRMGAGTGKRRAQPHNCTTRLQRALRAIAEGGGGRGAQALPGGARARAKSPVP